MTFFQYVSMAFMGISASCLAIAMTFRAVPLMALVTVHWVVRANRVSWNAMRGNMGNIVSMTAGVRETRQVTAATLTDFANARLVSRYVVFTNRSSATHIN